MTKRTKIVCTIGPATHTEEKLKALVEAGMNVCRLNFSHGSHEDHAELITLIRSVSKQTGEPLMILQDLQGPKIRVGDLPASGIELKDGQEIVFTTGTPLIPSKLPVTYPALHTDVRPGQHLLLDDGLLAAEVVRVEGQDVVCRVINGGLLKSHKGLNLPETKTSIAAMSDKDRDDVQFGIEQAVDWIALSFVRTADDVRLLREHIHACEQKGGMTPTAPIRVMAKIEKPEAVEHMDAIIAEVDGIMVARGDLGIEMPAEKVPLIQKQLIAKCLEIGKPVVVATQMLDSMIRNPRPTRAEVSDIANAVIDHADATMLSGETATGAYPVEAVRMMAATIRETEASAYDDLRAALSKKAETANEAMTHVASILAKSSHARAIVVVSPSGEAAKLVIQYRPELPIFAVVGEERIMRQLNVSWGIQPLLLADCTMEQMVAKALRYVKKQNSLQAGEQVIVVAGEPLGSSGQVNLVELCTIE